MNILGSPSAAITLRARRVGRAASVLAMTTAAAIGGIAASAAPAHAAPVTTYSFSTFDNSNDLTFNQLLGINNNGVIAGYFGSGMAGHPNKGYYLLPGYDQLDYRVENFPGSTQTQVTGLNDGSTQVGFYSQTNTGTDANYAWYSDNGGLSFHAVNVPHAMLSTTTPVTQLLGVNDDKVAVGFYTDSNGNNHGFTYSIRSQQFTFTTIPGVSSLTDTAINNHGLVAGFFTSSNNTVESFLQTHDKVITLAFPGASSTQAFGLNDANEVVGSYMESSGATHGFTWTPQGGFQTVDDPNGVGATTVNGVNDHGDLVGFYTDSAGNTDGMLAMPS